MIAAGERTILLTILNYTKGQSVKIENFSDASSEDLKKSVIC